MEEKFDKQLSSRIQKVFEEYEDQSAEEGWNRFRQKYPEKERQRRILDWWWTSFVAVALLLLAFWLFWPVDYVENKSEIVKTQPKTKVLNSAINLNKTNSTTKNNWQKKYVETLQYNQKNTVKIGNLAANDSIYIKKKHQQQSTTTNNLSSSNNFSSSNSAKSSASKKNFSKFEKVEADSLKEEIKVDDTFSPLKEARQVTLLQTSAQNQTLVFQPEIKLPVKTVLVVKDNIGKKKEPEQSKFGFGVYTDTHLNYAKGSNNQFGFGAGFSFDYKLTKKLKLSTGLSLLQNKLNYVSNFPQNIQPTVTYFSTPASGVTTASNIQSLNNVTANLLVLDLPINLKYQLYSGKNSIFIAAGVSSNAFANESYSYNYINPSASSSLPTQTSTSITSAQQSEKISKSFKSFDFARTLNLSFGFAYPLGKNQIEIEPFLKYPLAGLGSQQLFFGSGGINLRFNFQSITK